MEPALHPAAGGLGRAELSAGQRILRLAEGGRHAAARIWLIGGVGFNLALLGWFKYADFLLHLAAPHARRSGIVLPLAISFFTFQQIMFLVDSAHRAARRSARCPTLPSSASSRI